MIAMDAGACTKMIRPHVFIAPAILLVSACASTDPGVYQTLPVPSSQQTVTVGGGSTGASAALAAERLNNQGFLVRSGATGQMTASADGTALIDCGTLRQVALGNSATFPGNSDVSVIYTNQDPLEFTRREVSAASTASIAVEGDMARVSEGHAVTMSWTPGGKGRTASQTQRITDGELVRFADGTVCTSAGNVARIIGSG